MNTMQQEFDAVVTHLFKQGRPAKDSGGEFCMYRGTGGTSCAVGCRIPDAMYTPDMDDTSKYAKPETGTGVVKLLENFGDSLPEEIKEYRRMFSHLQAVHDGCNLNGSGDFGKADLAQRLQEVANSHGLTFTVPA